MRVGKGIHRCLRSNALGFRLHGFAVRVGKILLHCLVCLSDFLHAKAPHSIKHMSSNKKWQQESQHAMWPRTKIKPRQA